MTVSKATRNIKIFSDFCQFLVADRLFSADTWPEWTDEALQRKLAAGPDSLAVGAEGKYFVGIGLDICDSEPPEPVSGAWLLCNEASLEISSGRLIVCECVEDFESIPPERQFDLGAGSYEVRILYGPEGEMRDDDEPSQFFRIHMWPGDASGDRHIRKTER